MSWRLSRFCMVVLTAMSLFCMPEVKSDTEKNTGKLLNINEIPAAIKNTQLRREDIPSPHWKDDACVVCHLSQSKASGKNLRKSRTRDVCLSCHDARYDHRYIHPIDIRPSENMLARMNVFYKKSLQKSEGKISCISCHDIAIQCKASKSRQKLTNPRFFRLGPFETRSQPCYFCHDRKQYQRLNPHRQINESGKIIKQKCRICHAGSIEKLIKAKSIDEVGFHAEDDNLNSMCWGCHVWTPHPGGQFSFFKKRSGPNHLIKPPAYILNDLKKAEDKQGVLFPLEPKTGRIFCGTCHNPHEKGVIGNKAAAQGADSKRRLRSQKICNSCHNK